MKPAYIVALVLALLVAPPRSYGEPNEGEQSQAESPCLSVEVTGGRDSRVVNLRVLPIRDDAIRERFWEELKRIAEPDKLVVAPNQSPKDAMRARCGTAPEDLQRMLINLNPGSNLDKPGNLDIPGARELIFIPCPYWAVPETHPATKRPIRKGQSLTDLLLFYMGTAGKLTLEKIQQLNPNLLELLDAKNVATRDGDIQLPYVTAPVKFRLRGEIYENENSVEINRKLKDEFERAIPTEEMHNRNLSNVGITYHLVAEDGPQGAGDILNCTGKKLECGDLGGKIWPFDLDKIESIYNDTRRNLEVITPCVLIADTGLDLSDPMSDRIKRIIWNNPLIPRTRTRYGSDKNGPNVVLTNGDIKPSKGYPLSDHGTEVLKVMSGGSVAREDSSLLKAFKIAVAKITPESKCSDISPTYIEDAFRYADDHANFSVLNLSVVARDGGAIEDGLKGTRKFLVVVSAGNKCKSVEEAGDYPPALTGYRDRLIVVGAHDWDKKITDFSNYSDFFVDLLAPGCDIPIPGKEKGKTVRRSGTSFAAPFVAFTAALLASYYPLPPEAIKSRILATVDFDERLADKTKSGGRLNIENALSINDDILVIKDSSGNVVPLRGELDPYQDQGHGKKGWTCIKSSGSKRIYYPNQVVRVVPQYPVTDVARVALVWAWPSKGLGAFSENKCDSLEGVVKFRLKGAGSSSPFERYNWRDVISVMPRIPPP